MLLAHAPSSSLARSCVFIANVPVAASVIAPAFVLWHAQRPQTWIISPTFTVAPSLSLTCLKYVNTLSVAETELGGTLSVCFYFFSQSQIGGSYKHKRVRVLLLFGLKWGKKTYHIVSSSTTTHTQKNDHSLFFVQSALAEW